MLVGILIFISLYLAVTWGTIVPLIVGMAASMVVLAAKVHGLEKKDKEGRKNSETQIALLKERLSLLEKGITKEPIEKPAEVIEKIEVVEEQPPVKEEPAAQLKVKIDETLTFEIPPETPGTVEETVPPEPEKTGEVEVEIPLWEKLQQRFIENWTGILGSIIMVMGVGFLGVYTALKVSPPYRFGMTVLFSVILFGIFLYLKSKSGWVRFALWLRSSAGAIFLFACLGSSTMEGLKWLNHPLEGTGLLLLLLGIGVNLLLALVGGHQVFASLHVLLSLAALAIAPPTLITFIVATVVTLFGVALTYREKWDYHLLLTISLYFAYHLYWYYNAAWDGTSKTQHLTGIICTALVGILTLLVHYRSLYRTTVFKRLPFFVHFINWFYFGIGLYIHSLGSPWKPVIIAAGSVAAFFLARKARKIGIRWLYVTDTLVAQAIMLVALFSIYKWKVDSFFIFGMIFLEILLFLVIMIMEEEKFLSLMGSVLKYISGAALFIYAFVKVSHAGTSSLIVHGLTLTVCLVFAAAFHLYLQRKFGGTAGSFTAAGDTPWLPYIVYFIHVFYAVFALYLSVLDWRWKPPVIALLSIVIYITARWDKSRDSRPLYVTGTLVAQAAALLALLSLSQLKVDGCYIYGLMFIESLLFLVYMIKQNEKTLWKTGTWGLFIIAVILIAIGLGNVDYKDTETLLKHAGIFLACMAALTLFHIYTLRKFGETFAAFKTPASTQEGSPLDVRHVSWIGILIGILLLGAYINTYQLRWWGYILAAVGMVLIYIRHRFQSNGLGFGLLIFVPLFHAFGWNYMSLTDNIPVTEKIIYSLPFLILTFTGIRMPYLTWAKRSTKAVGIYLFYLHLAIASYYTFTRVSPFAAGTFWLLVSIITLELTRWLRRKYGSDLVEKGEPDRFLLQVGYLSIAAFIVRHLAVHLDTAGVIGIFPLRSAVAFLAIFIFLYWALRGLPERENSGRVREYLQPLFMELIIAFSVLTAAVELNPRWFPLVWIVAALALLLAGRSLRGETSRIRFYSLLLYWASAVYVALIPGTVGEGSIVTRWYVNPGVIDTVVIVLQFVYILLIHKLPFLEGVTFPRLMAFWGPLSDLINRGKNPWIHYPLFIGVALFLYQSFSRAILTLLWVVECFFIFVSSVILKENHFRYVAMTGLALTLLRLVFYDMAKSDTLTRALVFIGVGVIMLVMNSIYNKYKSRF